MQEIKEGDTFYRVTIPAPKFEITLNLTRQESRDLYQQLKDGFTIDLQYFAPHIGFTVMVKMEPVNLTKLRDDLYIKLHEYAVFERTLKY